MIPGSPLEASYKIPKVASAHLLSANVEGITRVPVMGKIKIPHARTVVAYVPEPFKVTGCRIGGWSIEGSGFFLTFGHQESIPLLQLAEGDKTGCRTHKR